MTLVSQHRIQPLEPGWVRYLNHRLPGETPSPGDDFFTRNTTADYTPVTPLGTVAWSIGRGKLSANALNQGNNDIAGFMKALAVASPPVTIETALSAYGVDLNYTMGGLCMSDGLTAGSNAIFAVYYQGASSVPSVDFFEGTFTGANAGSASVATFPLAGLAPFGFLFLRLIWTAANTFKWNIAPGPDGPWVDFGSGAETLTMTPTHFGPAASTFIGATPALITYEYLRFYAADLSV